MNNWPSAHEPSESPLRLTFIMDGPIRRCNPPVVVVNNGRHVALARGAEIFGKVLKTVGRARRQGDNVTSAALLRTSGGYVDIGSPLVSSINFLDSLQVPTTAFIDGRAQSYGARILTTCRRRVSVPDAEVCWHQTYHRDSNEHFSKGFKPELAFPREYFRTQLRTWLEGNTVPEHQHWVLARAEEAFADPENHLDDVDFKAWELKRAGLIDTTVDNTADLSSAYAKTIGLRPEVWHARVKRFFFKQA